MRERLRFRRGGSAVESDRWASAVVVLLASSLVWACGSGASTASETVVRDSAGVRIVENEGGVWPEGGGWQVSDEPLLQIGVLDGDPDYMFSRVVSTLRLDDGRIVVANAGTSELRFYDEAGELLHKTGRSGGGPGEFEFLRWVRRFQGDSLIAYDASGHRLSILDSNGAFVRSASPEPPPPPEVGGALPVYMPPRIDDLFDDGSIAFLGPVSFPDATPGELSEGWSSFIRTTLVGETLDTVGTFLMAEFVAPRGELTMIIGPSFPRRTRWVIHGNRVYVADPDRYEVDVLSETGALLVSIRLDRESVAVTDAMVAQYEAYRREQARDADQLEQVEESLSRAVHPSTLPPVAGLHVDAEGHLWVQDYRVPGSEGPLRWGVFDPEGRLLGEVDTPDRFTIHEIGTDYLLGVWRDEFDVEYVSVLGLVKDSGDIAG